MAILRLPNDLLAHFALSQPRHTTRVTKSAKKRGKGRRDSEAKGGGPEVHVEEEEVGDEEDEGGTSGHPQPQFVHLSVPAFAPPLLKSSPREFPALRLDLEAVGESSESRLPIRALPISGQPQSPLELGHRRRPLLRLRRLRLSLRGPFPGPGPGPSASLRSRSAFLLLPPPSQDHKLAPLWADVRPAARPPSPRQTTDAPTRLSSQLPRTPSRNRNKP